MNRGPKQRLKLGTGSKTGWVHQVHSLGQPARPASVPRAQHLCRVPSTRAARPVPVPRAQRPCPAPSTRVARPAPVSRAPRPSAQRSTCAPRLLCCGLARLCRDPVSRHSPAASITIHFSVLRHNSSTPLLCNTKPVIQSQSPLAIQPSHYT